MNEVIQLRGSFVHHHALIEGDQVHLLDGGFLGGVRRVERFLKSRGLDFTNIKSIVISHGHLDHTLNITRLKELSGCQVYAPRKDEDYISGVHHYEGLNKIGGLCEHIGAGLLNYLPPLVDHWFESGHTLDIPGGLEVIGLPGHTPGHCGFLLRERELLFANDLFTNQFGRAIPPPRMINDDHEEALASIVKASRLPIHGLFLNHGRKASPEETFQDLKNLVASFK